MRNEQSVFIALFILVALPSWISAGDGKQIANGRNAFRISLVSSKAKMVAVNQSSKNLELNLEGFGQPIALKVNGGGGKTCRTTLEHKSEQTTVILSLPIPTLNTPCQMTAEFVSINSQIYKISLSEEEEKKHRQRFTIEKIS